MSEYVILNLFSVEQKKKDLMIFSENIPMYFYVLINSVKLYYLYPLHVNWCPHLCCYPNVLTAVLSGLHLVLLLIQVNFREFLTELQDFSLKSLDDYLDQQAPDEKWRVQWPKYDKSNKDEDNSSHENSVNNDNSFQKFCQKLYVNLTYCISSWYLLFWKFSNVFGRILFYLVS